MPPKLKPSSIFYPEFADVHESAEIPNGDISESDRKTIVASFPKEQQPYIHYAKLATLRYNTELEFDGIIACSPHFIGIFRRNQQTKKVSKSVVFHIFEILSLRIRKKTKILIFCRLPELNKQNPIVNCRIICASALRFAQIVRRNYFISTVNFSADDLCDFRATDISDFPTFIHDLSPSQQFQLTYYAFATRMKRRYNHEISEFYHDRIKYEDGIFDFGLLPQELTQDEMEPAILALYYIPYVHGIICHHKFMPWLALSLAPLVERSQNLRFIHMEDCGLTSGIGAVGEKIKGRPDIPISYYNFAYNKDGSIESLFEALKSVTNPVFYLNFGCCGLSSLKTLFEALSTNERLWHVKYLYFNGNTTRWDDTKIFCEHLKNLSDRGISDIAFLGIGADANGISSILQALEEHPQPIEYLSFEGTRMELSAAKSLLHYVKQATDLKVLDLSYTQIESNLCADIILQMSEFERIRSISIKLNGNDFSRVKLMNIAKGFLYSDLSVWTSVSLADNKMSTNDLDFLISFMWRMENLTSIDLSGNFSRNLTDIAPILKKIATKYLPKLTSIKIGGATNSGGGPGNLLYQMLDGMTEYSAIENLDLANNNLGEMGLDKVLAVLQANPKISNLYLDGNMPVTVEYLQRFLQHIYSAENITFFQFPVNDAFTAARNAGSGEVYFKKRMKVKRMRHQCIREINVHRKHAGMSMMMPFEAVPELCDLSEEIKTHMHELLRNIETRVHNGVCKDMGVTLPYLTEGQKIEDGGRVEIVDIGEMVKYHSENMKIRIHEEPDDELNDISDDDDNVPPPENDTPKDGEPKDDTPKDDKGKSDSSDSDSSPSNKPKDDKTKEDEKDKKSEEEEEDKSDKRDDNEEEDKKDNEFFMPTESESESSAGKKKPEKPKKIEDNTKNAKLKYMTESTKSVKKVKRSIIDTAEFN